MALYWWYDGTAEAELLSGPAGPASGSASVALVIDVSATGKVQVKASSSNALTIDVSSTGKVQVKGSTSSALSFDVSSAADVIVKGNASSALVIAVNSTAVAIVKGNASSLIELVAAATGEVDVEGSASSLLEIAVVSTGAVQVKANASSLLAIEVDAFVGQETFGTATSLLEIGVAATGDVVVKGSATSPLTIDVSSAGDVLVRGSASSSLGIDVNSVGGPVVPVSGSATILLTIDVHSFTGAGPLVLRVVAIEPKRAINAATLSEGVLALSGSMAHVVFAGPPVAIPPVVKLVTSSLPLTGSLVAQATGPSIETKLKSVAGSIAWAGAMTSDIVVGPPIGFSTLDVLGAIGLSGTVAREVTGPSLVTILRDVQGFLGMGATLVREVITPEPPPPTILTQDVSGTVTPAGDLVGIATGPSLVTVPASVDGTITPAGGLTTDTIAPPVTEFFKSVAGTITPTGALTRQTLGPSLVTVPKSVSGVLSPAGVTAVAIAPTFATKLQSVSGTITPAGAVTPVATGPSLVTKFKTVVGSLSLSGAKSDVIIPPPPNFFSKDVAGMITPTGTLARLVTGPSIETKPKAVSGIIVMSSTLSRATTGPSFEIKPKSVTGLITPSGIVTRLVLGNPEIVTKTIAGTITPAGSRSAIVVGGPPSGQNPLYTSMGAWETNEFDNFPEWPAVTFTRIPSTTTLMKQQFDAMRARGMTGGPAITNKNDIANSAPSGGFIFNMTKFQAVVDRVAAVSNVQSYIDDGTFTHFCIGDEFQHNLWNDTVDGNDIKAMALYVKSKFPTGVTVVVRMRAQQLADASWIPTGGWAGSLDGGWAQFSGPGRVGAASNWGAAEYYADQVAKFISVGLTENVLGLNWWNGGNGSSGIEGPEGPGFWVATPQEIRAAIDAAIPYTDVKFFMFWTDANNSGLGDADRMLTLQNSQPYRDAFLYAKNAGLARGATPPTPVYFTDTGFFAAPHPPPALSLSSGVRDELTGHKVFRLVNNARTQDAIYTSLNSDNSVIYYIKGTQGLIADVFWNIGTSNVQVNGERNAVGTTNPAAVADGWIWSKTDRKIAHFAAQPAPARIARRDIVLNTTTIVKNFSQDTRYTSFWQAVSVTSSRLTGLHANRLQEVFCAKVHNNNGGAIVGAVAWRSTDNLIWNYQQPSGRTIERVVMDDSGSYVVVTFTTGHWQVLTLNANGTITMSAILASGPKSSESGLFGGAQQMFESSGLGLRTWDIDPQAASPVSVYAHPQRSSKQDLYEQGRINAQRQDFAVCFLYQSSVLSQSWVQHSGAIYKINWTSEMAAQTYKLAPEVVRQGNIQLTKVP